MCALRRKVYVRVYWALGILRPEDGSRLLLWLWGCAKGSGPARSGGRGGPPGWSGSYSAQPRNRKPLATPRAPGHSVRLGRRKAAAVADPAHCHCAVLPKLLPGGALPPAPPPEAGRQFLHCSPQQRKPEEPDRRHSPDSGWGSQGRPERPSGRVGPGPSPTLNRPVPPTYPHCSGQNPEKPAPSQSRSLAAPALRACSVGRAGPRAWK